MFEYTGLPSQPYLSSYFCETLKNRKQPKLHFVRKQ